MEGLVELKPNSQFWNGKRVFLTGHTGFKGSWATQWLLRMGAEVTGYSLDPETESNLFETLELKSQCESHIEDIRNYDSLSKAIKLARPEVVIHMAAQPLVRRSYRDPVETYSTNVMGTVHLLESVRHHGTSVGAIVVVTSDKCYENREWSWGYRESDRMGGHDPYSNSKGCTELVVSSFRNSYFNSSSHHTHAAQVATGRAGNVIGGGDWSEDRLIPDIMKSCLERREVFIRNPTAIRPWQHVLEPINGYFLLAEKLMGSKNNSFAQGWNFGPADGDVKTVEWIVHRISQQWAETKWKLSKEPQPHEAHFLKLDSSMARDQLHWSPTWNIEATIDKVVEWYKAYQSSPKDARNLTLHQIEAFCKNRDAEK